jgi:hypothetical protein
MLDSSLAQAPYFASTPSDLQVLVSGIVSTGQLSQQRAQSSARVADVRSACPDLPLGGRRRVVVQAIDRDEGCRDCGVISTKVHAWVKQQVRDIPAGGDTVEVVVRKRRMVCA